MGARIRVPENRECTQCGREEAWDEEAETWRVVDGSVGDVYCLHAWDITGDFAPIEL